MTHAKGPTRHSKAWKRPRHRSITTGLKAVLTEFFIEFVELFFPRLASQVEPGSIEFLGKEVFPQPSRRPSIRGGSGVEGSIQGAGRLLHYSSGASQALQPKNCVSRRDSKTVSAIKSVRGAGVLAFSERIEQFKAVLKQSDIGFDAQSLAIGQSRRLWGGDEIQRAPRHGNH